MLNEYYDKVVVFALIVLITVYVSMVLSMVRYYLNETEYVLSTLS